MRSRRGLGRENTGSRQHIACMYSNTASFGKICAPCIRKAPQSAVGECTARTSCRQGALSPSEAPKSCTARKSCHPLMDLSLRRGSRPSNRIAGSPFNGLALAQGCLPITVRDKPPIGFGGEHSAHCLRYGQAPRGRRSGASGWPSAPAPKRARGGVATEGARRSERLIGNCRARAPRPGNVGVAGRAPDRPDDWRIPPWHHREGREPS